MKKILLLDNYDSFTYNLQHLIEKSEMAKVEVVKNDKLHLNHLQYFDKIVLSPGPGIPSKSGMMPDLLQACATKIPIFGVCLGMQAIAEHFSCRLKNLNRVFHGIATPIHLLEKKGIFAGCPDNFLAARYHSWVVDENAININIVVTAVDENGLVMAIRHKTLPLCGVQFHPESILSEYGERILNNWINS